MKTAKPFIDLGFYVVPISNVLKRQKNGKKTAPVIKGAWKELYLETRYEPAKLKEPYPLTAALIAGKRSGAVAIDCDNQETYDIVKSFNPDYEFEFISNGKKQGGGSIIYRYVKAFDEIPKFAIHNGKLELDFQTDDHLQYLPTSGNKTKVEWKQETLKALPELEEPPDTVINYLKSIYSLHVQAKEVVLGSKGVSEAALERHYKNLAPFCEAFLSNNVFNPELFRILTPKDGGFRELPEYVSRKTLHPDSIPDGKGNEYITKLAGTLVCDNSVSPSLFQRMMFAVNDMWSEPLAGKDIKKIINYQLNRKEFVYDEDWHEKVSLVLTEYGTMINVFYDPLTRKYYALDNHLGMSVFNTVDALPKHLNSVARGGRQYKTSDIYSYLDKKKTIVSPLEPFGELEPEHEVARLGRYNLFARSKQYDVLLNPKAYKEEYQGKTPETTLAFFEHLIPDDDTRNYVLRFIYTKLVTLQFSEIVLYFLGVQGAGKNLFVDWLSAFCVNNDDSVTNNDYQLVVEVDLDNFLAKYNLWIVNALFANLDEYGEKTTSPVQDKQVLAILKSYTGKSQIQLRTMGTDPLPASHKCTFILTANINRLAPSLDDRRLVLIDSPTPLDKAPFVVELGGKHNAIQALFKEQDLFAYYMATKFKRLKPDDYRTPPMTAFKEQLIKKHLPPSERIVEAVKAQDAEAMIQLCDDNGMLQDLIDIGQHGIVDKPLLKDLFMAMVEGTAARKSTLDRTLRDHGMMVDKFWVNKRQVYGFKFITLKKWANKHVVKDGVLLKELNS